MTRRSTLVAVFTVAAVFHGMAPVFAAPSGRGLIVLPTEAESPALDGEKAAAHLRATRHYDSLAQALTTARYAVRETGNRSGHAWAQNPAHGLNATFDETGLTLSVRPPGEDARIHTTRWRLESLGYGETRQSVPTGKLRRNGPCAEIARPELALTEWFVNTPGGLEHGFTLDKRPAQAPRNAKQPLTLRLEISGDLVPHVIRNGAAIELHDSQTGRTILTYDKLVAWDADHRPVPTRMHTADANSLVYEVDDAGAHYPITVDPTFAQQAYLKASNTDGGDHFGDSVAISGDTAVVGAPEEDSNATSINGDETNNAAGGSGAAYVFTRSGNTWSQEAYLKASNAEAGDGFGRAVAISGDTIVVGADSEDSSATGVNDNEGNNSAANSGAAYVFTRTATTWSQQAYLKASNTDEGDNFGGSVAISGDTVIVGARSEDSNATTIDGNQGDNSALGAGAAYVFIRDGVGDWSQQAYLKASNAEGGDAFGESVAVDGDTVVIGAVGEDSNANSVGGNQTDNNAGGAGAAYVFTRSGITWSQQAYLKASNAEGADLFGESAAISGDTIVVGANEEDSEATGVNGNQGSDDGDGPAEDSGAAYVFTRSGVTWSQQAYLKASNTGKRDRFGGAVAVSGGIVVVGARFESSNAMDVNGDGSNNSASISGAAYVFSRSGANWTQDAYLKASNTESGDFFGISVAVSADTVIVGARDEGSNATGIDGNEADNSATESGAVYVFHPVDFVPDGHIGKKAARQKGNNVYNATGAGQTQKIKMVGRKKGKFFFTTENDGAMADSLRIGGIRKNKKLKLKVFQLTGGRRNVTGAIGRSALNLPIASGAKVLFKVTVKGTPKVRGKRAGKTWRIRFMSAGDGSSDAVKAKVKKKP